MPVLPKVHSGAEGGPLNFPDSVVMILSMHVYAECLHLLRATVDNNHMFSKIVLTLALPSVFHAHHPAKLAFVPNSLVVSL